MTNYPQWARRLVSKMALHGVQPTDIARHYGVSKQYVSAVLNGKAKNEAAATAYINDALDAIRAERGAQ
jgi:cyanate lyase